MFLQNLEMFQNLIFHQILSHINCCVSQYYALNIYIYIYIYITENAEIILIFIVRMILKANDHN